MSLFQFCLSIFRPSPRDFDFERLSRQKGNQHYFMSNCFTKTCISINSSTTEFALDVSSNTLHKICNNISPTHILPYNNKIYDSFYKWKNTGQWKPVFSHILCSNTDIYFFLAVIVHRYFPLDSASFFLIYSSRNNLF